jgi:hypothetical protein
MPREIIDGVRTAYRVRSHLGVPWLDVVAKAPVARAGLQLHARRGGSPPLPGLTVATGDPAFDRDFIVEAAPRDLALAFLDEAARRDALALRLSSLRAQRAALRARFELPHGVDVPEAERDARVRQALAFVAAQARRVPELHAAAGPGDPEARMNEIVALRAAHRRRVRRERMAVRAVFVALAVAGAALLARVL